MSAITGRNEPEESELEACIDYAANVVNVDAARAELAQLRATVAQQAEKLAEYERIKAMLPYDDKSMTLFQAVENLMHDDSADEIIRQAAQLKQALELIKESKRTIESMHDDDGAELYQVDIDHLAACDEWITNYDAQHAQAQQA